jgi:RND family efflux transporter MFP subunit
MNRVVLSIVLMVCLTIVGCKPKPVPPNPPTPVNIVTVTAQRVFYYDKYPATTQALSQVSIFPEVQGYITGIFFTEGAHVTKGQKLYEIDIRLYQAAYDQAVANLKVAQNNQEQAQQDADRYEYLNAQNAVAKQIYDHAVIALKVAKSSTAAAEETVKTAKTNLSYAVITAPFDGTIGFSSVKIGNMVSVGQTILNTISTDDPMAVDFLINEKQLSAFDALNARKQEPQDSLFTILMPDNTLYPYTGKISVIDRAVDPQTGALRIRLTFANPKLTLRAGMSCVVRVHNQEAEPVILIPGKAVVEQMGEYFVFTAKDTVILNHADSTKKKEEASAKAEPDTAQKGPEVHAFQKKVLLGQTIGPNVVVTQGIEEGDRLVVDGVQLLHDGSRISLGKPASKDGGKSDEAKTDGKPETKKEMKKDAKDAKKKDSN